MKRLLPLPFLALAAVAKAGSWSVTYSGGYSVPCNSSYHVPFQNLSDGYGGNINCAYGPIVATFSWHASYQGEMPDSTVYVKETCNALGTTTSPNSDGSQFTPWADNGLGTKPIITSAHVGPNNTGAVRTNVSSSGSRVTQVSTGGVASFQISASPTAGGRDSCSVRYSATVVDYAVSIFSDRDESFHKGASGPETNSTAVLTPRFGDTWVDPASFVRQGNLDDPDLYDHYVCAPTFTGDLIGAWNNPLHQWNLDGTTFTDDLFHEYNSVTKEWDYDPDAFAALSDSPDSKNITLNVTDSGGNGVSANASYTLRIHHPYEKWHRIGDLNDIAEDVGDLHVDSPGYASAHASIHCTYNNPGPEWKLLSVVVTVGSSDIKGSVWKYFFKAAGIAITDLGPKASNGDPSFDLCWGTAQSTISGGSWSDDMTQFQMTPRLVLTYHAHKYEADGYGPHGYIGPVREGATDPNEFSRQWAGDFSRISGNPGGGGS